MKQNQGETKPVSRTPLANGAEMLIYDNCRQVAGDRWLVRLRCQVAMQVAPAWFAGFSELGPEDLAELKARLGKQLVFEFTKERNFVAAAEKESTFAALAEQVRTNALEYLANPAFPEKLFGQRVRKLREQLLVERQVNRLAAAQDSLEDDDGPADFSACFKD